MRTGKARRQDLILAELRINRSIRVSELAEKFSTSTETIRRDLDEMKTAELLNRTHGGATPLLMGREASLFEREQMFAPNASASVPRSSQRSAPTTWS